MNKKEFDIKYGRVKFKIDYPVLDIGGAEGSLFEHLNITKGIIIDLIENQNPKYDYIKADISKRLPTIETKFKTIFLTETLEHLRNPLYLMAQVFDLLHKKGYCYISIPYTPLNHNDSLLEWDLDHVSRWQLRQIKDQMEKLGFNVKVVQKHRRFKGLGFWLPHCWVVLELNKRKMDISELNKLKEKKQYERC